MSGFVCKHCGSDEITEEVLVTCSAWRGGSIVEDDEGRPSWNHDGMVRDLDSYDGDVETEGYRCGGCQQTEGRLSALVDKGSPGESGHLCGRCDHKRDEHPIKGWTAPKDSPYTRGPMPCNHEGCRCADYYDTQAVAA